MNRFAFVALILSGCYSQVEDQGPDAAQDVLPEINTQSYNIEWDCVRNCGNPEYTQFLTMEIVEDEFPIVTFNGEFDFGASYVDWPREYGDTDPCILASLDEEDYLSLLFCNGETNIYGWVVHTSTQHPENWFMIGSEF